jgi:hypothetical protein
VSRNIRQEQLVGTGAKMALRDGPGDVPSEGVTGGRQVAAAIEGRLRQIYSAPSGGTLPFGSLDECVAAADDHKLRSSPSVAGRSRPPADATVTMFRSPRTFRRIALDPNLATCPAEVFLTDRC